MSVNPIKNEPFPIIESSFSSCLCLDEMTDYSEIYVNKKREVKQFLWFSTFLWDSADVESSHHLIRGRILTFSKQYLSDYYYQKKKNLTMFQASNYGDQINIQSIYAQFLKNAYIDASAFKKSKKMVSIWVIKIINRVLLETKKFCDELLDQAEKEAEQTQKDAQKKQEALQTSFSSSSSFLSFSSSAVASPLPIIIEE